MEEITNDDLDVFLIQIRKKLNQDKEQEFHAPAFVRRNSGLGFTLGLPAEFDMADDQTAAGIFWSEKRSSHIWVNENKDAGFTLQLLEEAEEEPLAHSREKIRRIMEGIDNRVVFYDQGEEKSVLWFDYKGFAGKEATYNLVFLFQAKERKALGSFFCPFEAYDRWRPVVLEVLNTIEKEETDERI